MLQSNKGNQEGGENPQIPISRETQNEETKAPQEGIQQKKMDSEGVAVSASEERDSVVTPAFGFSASRAQYSEQEPNHQASAFIETNQNSSHLILTTQRPFQSLLTPTLFMKNVAGSLPLRQTFQSSRIGEGSGNIRELNDSSSNAANSQMNANNDAEIQRMIVDQHSTDAAATGFTVVGTLKQYIQTPYENKFESPMRQKPIAQRSLSFLQQQVKQSPVKIIMQRQQTTPAKEGKSEGHHDDANASSKINKENFNFANITNLTDAHQVQDQGRNDQNLKMLHMQMFDSPDKRAHHLKNQMSAQNESPAANSCQRTQIAFANLNLSNTAGKYQSVTNQQSSRIQSGAILGGLTGAVAPSATDRDHSTSKYDDEYIMKQHLTQSPMFKGAFVPYSPKGSPFQARVLRDNHAVITSLNMKMDAHAQDNDILPMQIMSNHNEAERQQYLGGDVTCEQQRIFNPDLDEEALNQLKSLGPTPQRPGAISKSGEKELKARRLFQSPSKESVSNAYPQSFHRSSFVDDRLNIGSVSHNNLQTASISSQVGLKQLSGSKTQNRKTYNNPLEEIAEEPQRNSDIVNNNSLNYPLFSNHHHPFDSMMISNNSAQLRLNSMLEGPNSGDSGRKMRSYISSIMPDQNNFSGANNGQTDFSQNQNPGNGGRLVSRLDNEFTMAENHINHSDDHQYSSFINPLSFMPGSIEQNHFSFNPHQNDMPQQHQHSHHPQFQLGSYVTNTANGQQENMQLLKKYHHLGGAETSSSQMRSKHNHGVGTRNLTQNFQQLSSTQIYDGKKSFTTMSFGNFQNDQMQHPVYHHQCKCGANYQLPIVKSYQPQSHAIQNAYGSDAQSISSNGAVSQPTIRHVAHTGNRLRHNHHQHHLMSGGQRSVSMKVGQRNLGNNQLPHHPHHHRVPKGTSLHKQAARQAAQNGMMPQFDLKNSNFINTNIQMNVYIPSPTEQQQQAHSSHSSQSKINNLNNEGLIIDGASVHNEVSADMEGCIVNAEDANNAIQNSNAANKTGSFNQMQSMSSSKKNTSGLKKRLYPQFLNSSNKKNSTSKSNQKSNMKKKIQELNNQQQISSFDVNHSSQQINPTLGDDSKFQTPKGPNIFHHQLSVKASSGSGMMQGMNFLTPDDDKEMGGSSTQKSHQAVFQHSIANHQRHQLLLSSSGPHSDFKIQNIMESGDKNQPNIRVTCNCKKSKCLKLYCDCFALGLGCGPDCNCQDCCNADGNEERKGAMESILERNPQAFKPKIPEDTGSHSKGCRCKKSGCQKKYCECYQSGVLCSDKCVCDGCLNCDEHSKLPKSSFVPLRIPRDPEDQIMVDDFHHQLQVTQFKEPEEEKQAPPEIISTSHKFEQKENQEMESSYSNLKVNDSNQQNHQQSHQQEEPPSTTKKSRATRSIAHDLEKLLLSNDKNQASPAEEIVDNIEAKHSSRKRRAIDLNQSQILQHQTQLTSTPIAKKTKQQISQSSAKASNKNLVNRVALMEVQQIMNEPSVPQISQMATPSSGKKATSKQTEMKKTPIKPIQMMSQNQEDAAMATNAPTSAAKQQEHQTTQQSHKQQPPSSQPAAAAANVTSCITTRSKRKQLEAATSLSDQKPPRNL